MFCSAKFLFEVNVNFIGSKNPFDPDSELGKSTLPTINIIVPPPTTNVILPTTIVISPITFVIERE